MNRSHTAIEAPIKMAQDVGFQNITIDLIYGTPGMSNQDWKYNLEKLHLIFHIYQVMHSQLKKKRHYITKF